MLTKFQICHLCDKSAKHHFPLSNHPSSKHGEPSNHYPTCSDCTLGLHPPDTCCSTCGEIFPTSQSLTAHKSPHGSLCGKTFPRKLIILAICAAKFLNPVLMMRKKTQWSPILCGSNYGQLIAHLKTKKLSIQLQKLLSAYHTNTTSSANLVENLLKVTSVRDYKSTQ